MSLLKTLTDQIVVFRDEQDWRQLHSSKAKGLSLTLEAAEVSEL